MISTVLLIASAIHAKQPSEPPAAQQPAAQQDKPGEQKPAPETLQLLKGMPRQQIMGEMRKIAAAMGTECNFCHVNPFSVDTPRKSVARLMMRDYRKSNVAWRICIATRARMETKQSSFS